MAIISAFFSSRKLARDAKVDLGGKIVDNGTTAPAGQRWELQYESAPKSAAIAELAAIMEAEVVDMKLEEVKPRDLMGLPRPVSKHQTAREYVLKDRKNNPVRVQVRRSKTNALLAAHMAKA